MTRCRIGVCEMHPELRPDTPAWRRLIAVPRAMPPVAAHFFDVALQMAGVVSGCYVASSNRGGVDSAGEEFEGRGCVVDPLGQTVVESSPSSPVAFCDIDPSVVAWKKTIYPCDVA